MKFHPVIYVWLILGIFLTSLSFAEMIHTHMPDSIMQINKVADLKPFLSNQNNSAEQFWGVKRLGQIGTSTDIPKLTDIFKNAPFNNELSVDRGKDIKDEAILAIGEIGGFEALTAILNILEKINISNIKSPDSMDIAMYACLALGTIGLPEAKGRLDSIYKDTSLFWGIRTNAYRSLILINLKGSEFTDISDTVEYLLENLSSNFSQSVLNKENYIITKAIYMVLYNVCYQTLLDEIKVQSGKYNSKAELEKYLNDLILSIEAKIKFENNNIN